MGRAGNGADGDLTGPGDYAPDIPLYAEALPHIAVDPRGNKTALSRIEPVVFVHRLLEVVGFVGLFSPINA